MYFVIDYNPKGYTQKRWAEDIKLMKELGIDVIRITELQWELIEKEAGNYDFSFYDNIIERLNDYGIDIILGTPSAKAPSWFEELDCLNNLNYLNQVKNITAKVVEHYQNKENIIGWQVDNNLSTKDISQCCCDDCKKGFQNWLKKKYQNLEDINKNLGTGFWSQSYSDWSQIPVPEQNWTTYNPSLLLDFYRFSSDTIDSYQKLQLEIIKHRVEGDWIREDFILTSNSFNYQRLKLTEPFDTKRRVSNKLNDLKEQIFWRVENLVDLTPKQPFLASSN